MAAADGAEDGAEEVPAQFECSICMKLLLDPVTVSCGHTFCRVCLEQSLGYRSLCAVCRAPVVAGQGINVLIRGLIAEQYPRALARRLREAEQDLRAGELQADEERRREARAGAGGDGPDAGAPLFPLLRWPASLPMVLPHCRAEVELRESGQEQALAYALQGGRRLGVVEASTAFDDAARPMGVCVEIESVEHAQAAPHCSRVRLAAKFRFWIVEEPQANEGGFLLGRCEAFFDAPLPASELLGSAGQAEEPGEGEPHCESIAEVAREALQLIEWQLVNVGQGGRHVFAGVHGEVPAPPAAGGVTSASMERLSFWLLGALVEEGCQRRQWLGSLDTRGRLQYSRRRLAEANGRRLLDLPGATSWMNPGQSALSSLALLVAIIALLVAKAMGWFDKGYHGRRGQNSQMEETAFHIWQLLR